MTKKELELTNKLLEALRDCMNWHCPGCGAGSQGVSHVHWIRCWFKRLEAEAEEVLSHYVIST